MKSLDGLTAKMTLRLLRQLFLPALFAALFARAATAHPMGPESYNHYAALTVHDDAVRIHYILDIAEFPTYNIIKNEIFARGGKTWTDADVSRYGKKICPELARGLALSLNGKRPKLAIQDCVVQIRESKYAPLSGEQKYDLRAQQRRKIPWYTLWVEMELNAPFALKPGATIRAEYHDANFSSEPAGWKEIELLESKTARITKQSKLNTLHSGRLDVDTLNELTRTLDPARMPQDLNAQFRYQAGAGAGGHADASHVDGSWLARLKALLPELPELLDARHFLPLALVFAFLLGCLHALTPGHGKTLVAAYLIGSRGRVIDAVFLGFVVTVSHVLSVVILGVILMAATTGISSARLTYLLEGGSGLLIVAIGIWMFGRNAAGRDTEHIHDRFGRHIDPATGTVLDQHPHGDQEHPHDHHAHDDPHDHGHAHNHRGHSHEPHAHGQTPPAPERAQWWDILVLGVTGGIVPCPTALIVLFSAVALHKIGLGLTLIVVFSLGLAFVLIVIGILMVKAKGFMDKHLRESGIIRFLPYVSATIITLIGIAFVLRAARTLGWL